MTCSPQQQTIVVAHLTVTEVKLVFSHIACSPEAIWEETHNKKSTSYEMLILFSNSTASRNFNMGILRIPFLCGLRLAKTILCLRASPGRSRQVLSAFVSLTSVLAWEQRQRLVVAGYHSTESKSEWISYKW